jgi:hypothetical protein
MEDVHQGEVVPDRLLGLIMNCCHSWCPSGLCVSCCQVYTLARLTIDSNLHDTLGHALQELWRSMTFIFCHGLLEKCHRMAFIMIQTFVMYLTS